MAEQPLHVRAHVDAEAAILGDIRALRQEDAVLEYLRMLHGRATPWQVAEALELHVVSTRRAMTNLCRRGLLVHHPEDRRASGPLGAKSGTWEAA